MKREVTRERNLPAFSIGIAEMQVLWDRVRGLFDQNEAVHWSIEISLKNERLQFRSVEELKEYSALRGKITNFSLSALGDSRSIYIRSRGFLFSGPASVTASGNTEAWCAGAVETVYSMLQNHRIWYNVLVVAPIGWMISILLYGSMLLALIAPKDFRISKTWGYAWVVALAAMTVFHVSRSKLFPAAVLRLTNEENFIRRHAAELGLALAILSAILTVVGWFVGGNIKW